MIIQMFSNAPIPTEALVTWGAMVLLSFHQYKTQVLVSKEMERLREEFKRDFVQMTAQTEYRLAMTERVSAIDTSLKETRQRVHACANDVAVLNAKLEAIESQSQK